MTKKTLLFFMIGLTVSFQAYSNPTTKVGTITNLVAGDTGCYVDYLDENGTAQNELALFEVCEQTALIKKKVQFTYQSEQVLADSCQGNPECQDHKTVNLIGKVQIVP